MKKRSQFYKDKLLKNILMIGVQNCFKMVTVVCNNDHQLKTLREIEGNNISRAQSNWQSFVEFKLWVKGKKNIQSDNR